MPLPNRDMSDWDWVRKQIAADAPVPYDPNDDEAVGRFLTEANRVYPAPPAEPLPIPKAS